MITPLRFRIVPVIDLKGGVAVHAIGGRRDQYLPLRSIWQASASPVALASEMRQRLGVSELYVADLDAIEGGSADLALYEELARTGLDLWLDAGVRDGWSLGPLMGLLPDSTRIVIGLESVAGPAELCGILERAGSDRVIFSLDMDDGVPRVARDARWPEDGPVEIAELAFDLGVRRILLLDLRRVGIGRGIGTVNLVDRLRKRHPGAEIIVGGGIGGIDELMPIRERGASAVLIGSAIHDGRIGRRDLERIAEADDGTA